LAQVLKERCIASPFCVFAMREAFFALICAQLANSKAIGWRETLVHDAAEDIDGGRRSGLARMLITLNAGVGRRSGNHASLQSSAFGRHPSAALEVASTGTSGCRTNSPVSTAALSPSRETAVLTPTNSDLARGTPANGTDDLGTKKVGVVLLNLGGPERIQDVRHFLYNLFADPEIIRLPIPALQKPLARIISLARAEKSQEAYRSIGGGSPQRRETEKQARSLQNVLRDRGIEATTYVAMRYWHPYTETAIADLKVDGVDQVVVLPLYPHFSISTSGSSFRELKRLREEDVAFASKPLRVIRSYFDDGKYIGAMAELIAREIQASADSTSAHVFFSAHGVPRNYVEEAGDPYKGEIEVCTKLIMERLRDDFGLRNNHTLAYQSRVGPLEWLKPYTEETLRELGESGTKELVVVPISFTNEHIETLEEIDIQYREIAMESGIRSFRRVPTLGTTPSFIDALADLVQKSLEGPEVSLDEASVLRQFPSYGPASSLQKYLQSWLGQPR